MNKLATALLAALAFVAPAAAQQRQPAQITTLPTTTPQEFDLLDKNGKWMPFGMASGGMSVLFGAQGKDLRQYGCVDDGVTDQSDCINNAIANEWTPVIVPSTQNGWYVNKPIIVNQTLIGQAFNPNDPTAFVPTGPWKYDFPGQSWIKCGPLASPCVQLGVKDYFKHQPRIERLVISSDGDVSGYVDPASVGLRFAGGHHLIADNVAVFNFGVCMQWGPNASSSSGHTAFSTNSWVGACKTHYYEQDGFPDVHLITARAGLAGNGDYTQADDLFHITLTGPQSGGGGSNTLDVRGLTFSTAAGAVGCAVRFSNWAGTGGTPVNQGWLFDGGVWEWHHAYTGSNPTQGVICSDPASNPNAPAPVPNIRGLRVQNMEVIPFPSTLVFNLDPVTSLERSMLVGNTVISCGGVKLNLPLSTESGGLDTVSFINNRFSCASGATHTISTSSNDRVLVSSGNFYSGTGFTLTGTWNQFTSMGDWIFGGSTTAAKGNVSIGSPMTETWTPSLQFGGASTGITYTGPAGQAGTIRRNMEGGFHVSVVIALSSKGTATGSAQAQIVGLPTACKATGGQMSPMSLLNMTGLTASTTAQLSTGTSPAPIFLGSVGATGNVQLTYAQFTDTSVVQFTADCGTAQ